MRIISGSARGRHFSAPEGNIARPTPDRVKEALFSILQSEIIDAQVLDLFAGSGALGLECISRGAKSVTFVDQNPTCTAVLKQNIQKLGFEGQSKTYCMDYKKALSNFLHQGTLFDLIFLDPPYASALAQSALDFILINNVLHNNGTVIIEQNVAADPLLTGDEYTTDDIRKYGNTKLSFVRKR